MIVRMEQYKKFTKNVGFIGLAMFFLAVEGFLLLPILSKNLGAYYYGFWSQIKITATLLSMVGLLALNTAVIRFLSGIKEKVKISKEFFSVYFVCLFSGIILTLLIYFLSDILAILLLKDISASIFFKFGSFLILFFVLYEINLTYFRAFEQIKRYFYFSLFQAVGDILLVLLLLYLGFGLWGVIFTFLFVKIIAILIQLKLIVGDVGFNRPRLKLIKPYFVFSLPLILTPLLHWILQTGDQYVIGFYLGASSVGIYSLVYSLSYIVRLLADPIVFILQASLSKAWNLGRMDEVKTYLDYSYKYVFMITIPAAVGLSILSKPILKILSTSEFLAGAYLVPFLVTGFVVYCFYILLTLVLYLVKKTKIMFYLLLVLAVINIVLNIILVPIFDISGAAYATLITFLISAVVSIIYLKKYSEINLIPWFLIRVVICSFIMWFVIWIIREYIPLDSVFKIILIPALGVMVYFGSLYLMKGIKRSEINFFLNMFKK